jgi:hypothetical protein
MAPEIAMKNRPKKGTKRGQIYLSPENENEK